MKPSTKIRKLQRELRIARQAKELLRDMADRVNGDLKEAQIRITKLEVELQTHVPEVFQKLLGNFERRGIDARELANVAVDGRDRIGAANSSVTWFRSANLLREAIRQAKFNSANNRQIAPSEEMAKSS